jgi:DNA-binding NtrC family response regulator/predicted TIM-barrel enzyme
MVENSWLLKALLKDFKTSRLPLIFSIPGSGQIARYAVEGGAHFVMVLNAGIYRSAGVGSLGAFMPFGNANDQTESLLRKQILPRIKDVPIVVGLFANDPVFPLASRLKRMKKLGIAGITNYPFLGTYDGKFQKILNHEGFSIDSEIDMLKQAIKMGFATFGFSSTAREAVLMAQAGVEALVLNIGLTQEVRDIYEKGDRIQYDVAKINEMIEAVEDQGLYPTYLFIGGSITKPEDTAELYRHTKVHGYGGGSSFERIPIEKLVTNTVKHFCSVSRFPEPSSLDKGAGEMVGNSPPMQKLYKLIKKVAPYDVNICIEGESGVGKELVATQLHKLSHRSSNPFITLNCGAIPETLLESEFFGHEKGSFTGALSRRIGKFELADHGTLLLDEVAELSPKAQVSLLRVLQQKQISRVGGEKAIPVDVRIISATHQNLKALVKQGLFRADLYFRLNVITLQVSPLRAHSEDIPALVKNFLEELGLQFDKQVIGVTPEWMNLLLKHSWPGNIRELRHVLSRAILLEEGPILKGEDFTPEPIFTADKINRQANIPIAPLVKEHEFNIVINAINAAGGNKSKAAKMLGISRKTLYSRLKHMEID